MFTPDYDPAFMSVDPVLEPDKSRLEMCFRFNPHTLTAEVNEQRVVGFPFEMLERYNPQPTVSVHDYRLTMRFSHRTHLHPLLHEHHNEAHAFTENLQTLAGKEFPESFLAKQTALHPCSPCARDS